MQPPHSDPNQRPPAHQQGPGVPPPPPPMVNVNNYIQQPPPYAWVPVIGGSLNNGNIHVLHLILTIITCGAWAPIWIIHAIVMAVSDKPRAIYPVAAPQIPPAPGPAYPSAMPMNRNQQALTMLAQQKSRRAEARQLAGADPMSAKQLGIGRRDIQGRQYDDGGLIDINRVPAEVFTQFSGVTAEKAAQIVTVRESLGGMFSSVEEFMATAELPPQLYEEITEYAIVLR
jgi:DNA uptake protein ComE-like DNA-binding protein